MNLRYQTTPSKFLNFSYKAVIEVWCFKVNIDVFSSFKKINDFLIAIHTVNKHSHTHTFV